MGENNHNRSNYSRPILLSIFAILMVLSGIVTIVSGALLAAGGAVSVPISQPAGIGIVAFGGLVILFGIISILIGMALFSGKRWGWWFATIMTGLALIFSIVSLNYILLIIYLIVLLYLLMKNTKGWFGI